MTETNEGATTPPSETEDRGKRAPKGGGLAGKLLPELKQIAGGLGIKANGLKKAELVAAIRQAQSQQAQSQQAQSQQSQSQQSQSQQAQQSRQEQGGQQQGQSQQEQGRQQQDDRSGQQQAQSQQKQAEQKQAEQKQGNKKQAQKQAQKQDGRGKDGGQRKGGDNAPEGGDDKAAQSQSQKQQDQQDGDEEGGSRRNRRRRGRDRGGNQPGAAGRGNRSEPDLTVLDDDVLAPCAGILDVLDNYAFVRTSGYLPGSDDVYVSMSMVRKFGLRRGDAIIGQVRQPRDGERREKFNPLVQIDSVNGGDAEGGRERVDFAELTPVHPTDRLRLETSADDVTGRVVDLVAPLGKGQRGLVLSPSKAGKTTLLKSVAASITANNPEVHLMVVLVDERPEEVTDFQRSVRGEVVGSTFDRPATDHTTVAELAIERAQRLVELGHDVVVLCDGITRLGRAYNLAAPSGGRILAGAVDSAALHPTKRFFGAARNVENGGSLTILATATVESGSVTDETILEELSGTGNLEIRLRRELAQQGLFPAVDVAESGTRHEDALLGSEELEIVRRLRRSLASSEPSEALQGLLERLRASQSNIELLTQVQRSAPRLPDSGS